MHMYDFLPRINVPNIMFSSSILNAPFHKLLSGFSMSCTINSLNAAIPPICSNSSGSMSALTKLESVSPYTTSTLNWLKFHFLLILSFSFNDFINTCASSNLILP
ncbi:MAG: hypothetical protein [Betabaculovirus sp.]|nr:MAG: hypothetical protein [Betabaculovirus sp.]